jgi:hypothetical protein
LQLQLETLDGLGVMAQINLQQPLVVVVVAQQVQQVMEILELEIQEELLVLVIFLYHQILDLAEIVEILLEMAM